MAPLLLDTCAVIWITTGARLSDAANRALRMAASQEHGIAISPISAWEVGMLMSRGRLALTKSPMAWMATALDQPNTELALLPPEVLIESSFLPGEPPADPADRIIIATAREFGMRIVTRDRAILSYAEVGHAMALEC